MLTSLSLLSVLVTPNWSIGPFTVSTDDLYAIVGLIAGVATLSLWVMLEHFRQTLRRNRTDTLQTPDASEVGASDALPEAGPTVAGIAVPARAEWLLDDNTLVRMHVVSRGSLIPQATSQPEPPVVATTESPPAADATGADSTAAPMADNNDNDVDDTQDGGEMKQSGYPQS